MEHYETVRLAKAIDGHRLSVVFDNDEAGIFDCSAYFLKPYWKKLSDPQFFKQVYVDYGHLTWPGDIDISPIEVWQDTVRSSCNGD